MHWIYVQHNKAFYSKTLKTNNGVFYSNALNTKKRTFYLEALNKFKSGINIDYLRISENFRMLRCRRGRGTFYCILISENQLVQHKCTHSFVCRKLTSFIARLFCNESLICIYVVHVVSEQACYGRYLSSKTNINMLLNITCIQQH